MKGSSLSSAVCSYTSTSDFFFFFFFFFFYIYIFIYLPTRLQFFNKGKNIKKRYISLKKHKRQDKQANKKSLITKKKKHRLHD